MTKARIALVPTAPRRGDVVEVRTLIGHPMETGYRPGPDGRVLPRNIIRRFTCTFEGNEVFSADLHPAIAANPYLVFPLLASRSGTLELRWDGDEGFSHVERLEIRVA